MPPTLLTPHLRLRPATPDDAEPLTRLWRTPSVRRGLWDGAAITADGVQAALRQFQRLEAVGLGLWCVEVRQAAPRESRTPPTAPAPLVGSGGLRPAALGDVEPFVAIAARWRRRGYGTEVVQALCAYVLATPGMPEVVAWIDAASAPAHRLAARLGFTPGGVLAGPRGPVHAFVLAPEAFRRAARERAETRAPGA